jgi:hypothetical protein
MAIRWKWASAPVARASRPAMAARARAVGPAVAAALDELVEELPNLQPFPGSLDKAHVLLETAAEVEHMLLIQYLYSALTLKSGRLLDALKPDEQKSVRSWRRSLTSIAIEEMGHLMSVQNLRLFVGADPIFDREEFPPKADVYPFTLHLEPLSTTSLAKYVLAEAPFSEDSELERYREIVGQKGRVRHVGVIYGLLAVLFSARDTLPSPSSPDHWDQFVLRVAEACGAVDEPDHWHLADGSLVPASFEKQADPAHFTTPEPGFFFHRIRTAGEARDLLRRVGEQGEAPVDAPDQRSHYRRFRGIFEGRPETMPFPSDGSFVPSLDVDTDPRLDQYEGPALSTATELEGVYSAMVATLLDYLAAALKLDRERLSATAIEQMMDIRRLAKDLGGLPQKPGSTRFASPVFSPPMRVS